jgi:hypothetical protein
LLAGSSEEEQNKIADSFFRDAKDGDPSLAKRFGDAILASKKSSDGSRIAVLRYLTKLGELTKAETLASKMDTDGGRVTAQTREESRQRVEEPTPLLKGIRLFKCFLSCPHQDPIGLIAPFSLE